jgi:hypothetical protein
MLALLHWKGPHEILVSFLLSLAAAAQNAAPRSALLGYTEGVYTIKDFHFGSGEVLPELHLSYVTVGTPLTDGSGQVRNAVLRRGPPFSIPAARPCEFSLRA